ncbi:unnamed protein product [Candida parapsilosis]
MEDGDVLNMSIRFIDSIGLRGMGADELNYDGTIKKATKDTRFQLPILPAMARTFIRYNKFTRGNSFFKPKRILTQLFPTTYPFNSFTIDQSVNDESLVEV